MPALSLVTLPADAALDLHMHTTASDGRWTPATLMDRIAALGIGVMAIADHDALDSVGPARELAAPRGIAVVSGVEVTTRWDGRQWHLLVYGAEIATGALRALVDRQRRAHIDAANEAIVRLKRAGYTVPSLDAAIAGRPPLPIYVMDALIRDDLADTMLAANRLVTERLGVPFYIDVPLREAVDAAHAAGGLAILAHPGRDEGAGILAADQLVRMVDHAPIDGLEVHYPTHSPAQVAEYAALADHHGLLHSCGSDSHGPNRPRDPIPYPATLVVPLLARLGFRPMAQERRVMAALAVRPLAAADRAWADELLRTSWGGTLIVMRGMVYDAAALPAFVATLDGAPAGLATYRLAGDDCELVSLDSTVERTGVGSALIAAVRDAALAAGCRRVWLITTNDNTAALRFYQRRGFHLVAVHRDAIAESRRLKPQISPIGIDGIPIRDEIELELPLR